MYIDNLQDLEVHRERAAQGAPPYPHHHTGRYTLTTPTAIPTSPYPQGNFRDMGDHRVVSRDEAMMYIHGLDRPDGAAPVRYAESSMKNGYGLMHLHKFLSVPFLQLQVGVHTHTHTHTHYRLVHNMIQAIYTFPYSSQWLNDIVKHFNMYCHL